MDDQGPRCGTVWSGARSPAGVGSEHVQTGNCGSPGTWENPVRSSANSRREIPGYQLPALAAHLSARERKQRVHPRYRQAKETKCGGMAAGSRSTLIVPTKPGNWSRGTRPREGKTERRCLMLGPGPGTTSEASYSEPRITVTTQDSSPGLQRSAAWRIQHQRNRMARCAHVRICGSPGWQHPGPPGPRGKLEPE